MRLPGLLLLLLALSGPREAAADPVAGEWLVRGSRGDVLPVGAESVGLGYYLLRSAERPSARAWLEIQANYRYEALGSDPELEKSWGLSNFGQAADGLPPGIPGVDVGAPKAWAIHEGDAAESVAVLDSGVDLTHEELRANLWRNPGEVCANGRDDDGNGFVDDCNGWNFVDGDSNVSDSYSHGTSIAGVIAAAAGNGKGSRGVGAALRVMPLRVIDAKGVGTTAWQISAIEYAVAMGARVLSASWGGTEFDPALYEAVRWAGEQGALFVAAAGNNAKNNDTDLRPVYPASFRLPSLVTVAAYDNRDTLTQFSNFGRETVHLGAPGIGIFTTMIGGYRFAEGTSFAVPFVAAGAALLRSFVPGLSVKAVKERVLATTEVIHYYEGHRLSSGGRLNLYNLLRDIRPPRPAPPSSWAREARALATPHPYVNKVPVRFELEHPGATHVRVHFNGFSTEGCCDRVVLRDKTQRLVAAYSGKLGDFWSADALGDTLIIEMVPDYSMSDYGFEIDALEWSEESTLWSLLENNGARPKRASRGTAQASPISIGFPWLAK
jgi:thermitase